MDPARVATALRSLADALADADPQSADAFRRRAERYEDALLTLDGELRSTLDRIPAPSRELITSHDSLGYFADAYGFEVVATAFPASGAEAEPSACALGEVDAAEANGVPAVFAGEEDDPEVLRQIAEDTGSLSDGLLIESPGSAGTSRRCSATTPR